MPRLVPENAVPGAIETAITKSGLTIGRSRESGLCLEDTSVSRHHASILYTNSGYIIKDNGSSHGTQVNGQRIDAHQLAENDVIDVGIYRFRFVDTTTHLDLLLDVTRLINSSLALNEVLEHVMDAVIRVTHAERGFLMTIDAQGQLQFRVARNIDQLALQTDNVAVSFSILDKVRKTGTPVVMSDVLETETVVRPRSVIELGLRSLMCVPMRTQDRLTGLIYADSQSHAKGFSQTDLDLFQSLAAQAAVAIEKSQLYEQLHEYSLSLEEKVQQRTQELLEAQTEAAIGRLAAGIAHEINSPLGVLLSNADSIGYYVSTLGPNEIIQDIIASSAAASTRLRRILKAFESFAGLDQGEITAVRIDEAIDTVCALLEHETRDRISVARELRSNSVVVCSPGGIHQALMNVLLNAIQSIKGKGTIRVDSRNVDRRVIITIQDSGQGIPPDQLARIFEPGFSRKGNRVGAGMGLIVTRQIVHEAGGDIRIHSTPGEGTVVTLSLPAGFAQT